MVHIDDDEQLHKWLVTHLSVTTDADPDVTALYIEKTLSRLPLDEQGSSSLSSKLRVFLNKETDAFVKSLFNALTSGSYKTAGPAASAGTSANAAAMAPAPVETAPVPPSPASASASIPKLLVSSSPASQTISQSHATDSSTAADRRGSTNEHARPKVDDEDDYTRRYSGSRRDDSRRGRGDRDSESDDDDDRHSKRRRGRHESSSRTYDDSGRGSAPSSNVGAGSSNYDRHKSGPNSGRYDRDDRDRIVLGGGGGGGGGDPSGSSGGPDSYRFNRRGNGPRYNSGGRGPYPMAPHPQQQFQQQYGFVTGVGGQFMPRIPLPMPNEYNPEAPNAIPSAMLGNPGWTGQGMPPPPQAIGIAGYAHLPPPPLHAPHHLLHPANASNSNITLLGGPVTTDAAPQDVDPRDTDYRNRQQRQKRPHADTEGGDSHGRGQRFDKKRLDWAKSKTSLSLSHVPAELNQISELNNHFKKFGTIVNIQVRQGPSKTEAVIEFSKPEECRAAHDSPEPVLNNRFIKVFYKREDPDSAPAAPTAPASAAVTKETATGDSAASTAPPSTTTTAGVHSNAPTTATIDAAAEAAAHARQNVLAAKAARVQQDEAVKDKANAFLEVHKKKIALLNDQYELLAKHLSDTSKPLSDAMRTMLTTKMEAIVAETATANASLQAALKAAAAKVAAPSPRTPSNVAQLEAKVAQLKELAASSGISAGEINASTATPIPFGRGRGRGADRGRGQVRGRGRGAGAGRGAGRGDGGAGGSRVLDMRLKKIFVGGVDDEHKDSLLAYFGKYGSVTGIQRVEGPAPGFAVEYEHRHEAEKALASSTLFKGNKLALHWYGQHVPAAATATEGEEAGPAEATTAEGEIFDVVEDEDEEDAARNWKR